MANLTNFLEPRLMESVETAVRTRMDYQEWQNLREACIFFLLQGIFTGGAYKTLSKPEKDIVAREEQIIQKIWREEKILPAEMASSVLGEVHGKQVLPYQRKLEPLVRFSQLPKTKLGNIRNAAEKLSFVIIPYQYINQADIVAKYAETGQQGYAWEVQEGFKAVNELSATVSTWEKIELYILCPIGFYDPWQEVKDLQTRQKIFGGELTLISTILGMMMSTQKNLYQMSKTNAENIASLSRTMEANFTDFRRTLDDMQNQISWLKNEVLIARREAAEAKSTTKQAAETASYARSIANYAAQKAEEVSYRLAYLLDPLVFAVPQGTNLQDDDAIARLMMCFGADMPLDFFLRRGLVKVDDNGYYDSILRILK